VHGYQPYLLAARPAAFYNMAAFFMSPVENWCFKQKLLQA
jgi:hypothetical protein